MDIKYTWILSFLSTLLTGGFLVMLIEGLRVHNGLEQRFQFLMTPFFHSLSNYLKFISSFKTHFSFKETGQFYYMKKLKKDLDYLSRLGSRLIVAGRDYPINYFTGKQLEDLCTNRINDVWYCIDKDHEGFSKVQYDSRMLDLSPEIIKGYLDNIGSEYKDVPIDKSLLGKLSGDFFYKMYQPIQDMLYQMEDWTGKEKIFKFSLIAVLAFICVSMLLVLVFNESIKLYVFHIICGFCSMLLMGGLLFLMYLEKIANRILK